MNKKIFVGCITCLLILLSTPASSNGLHGTLDYYYNGIFVTESQNPVTPKPLLKIGEPFTLRMEVTCYKRNALSVMLYSIGNSDFDIIEGPTSRLGQYTDGIIEANETRVFEWTVAPNDEWAGGSTPINFYYQMTDLDTAKKITSGEFTAAYVTISNEYYEAPEKPSELVSRPSNDSSSASTPGFTVLVAVFALIAVVVGRRE
ncbi:sarcinarray family MAST domain-containing protein [Methanolobus sp. WCC5]|uniref:sarcinarray family MAST domain-containing protein n=1 Tax=Methanolobus sp. WCC5 TaxID=3125785 RepID=UPI00324333A6